MIQANEKRFEELIEEIKHLFADTTTSVRIVITANSTKIIQYHRHPSQFKKANISMRNIKGNFIKPEPQGTESTSE